ncbi:MAG: glucosaminidase domain-containing protein [Ferruginibacter sp.]|nr:glucosaminidase domain-containing protein [Cytophagales bacterium]
MTHRTRFLALGYAAGLLMFTAGCREKYRMNQVAVEYQPLRSASEIRPLTSLLVDPVLYTNAVSLGYLPTAEQKQKFIDLMLPAILVVKFNLEQKQARIRDLAGKQRRKKAWTREDSLFIAEELTRYRAKNIRQLARKVKPHPVSLVLAQAALESGWGTSNCFAEANNVFGVWSLRADEERIETSARRGGRKVFLRRYRNLSLSVEHYYETLGRVAAYRDFRNIRFENDNPYALLPQLSAYSELGHTYTRRLRSVIRDNRLTRYDRYRINPVYLSRNQHWQAFAPY